MAENDENQPPKQEEARSQPPGDEQPVAQPREADDEPKVDAVQNELKTPARPSKAESRFSILTALISALAALVGALVGGIASYMVAQSNNTAEAEAALAKSRLTDYADYLTAQIDFTDSVYKLFAYLQDTPRDSKTLSDVYLDLKAKQEMSLHTDFIVSLIDSDTVENARDAIGKHDDDVVDTADKLYGQVGSNSNFALNPAVLKDFKSQIDYNQKLVDDFTNASRADMTPPKRRLFPWSVSWTWVGRTLDWAIPLRP